MIEVIIVGAGGFLGAALRYLCSLWLGKISPGDFPIATLVVNIVGSFLIGFLSQTLSTIYPENKRLLLFSTTGFMGGFTTFSTFSLETLNLFQNGKILFAGLNVILSVGCCLIGVFLGKTLAKAVTT